MNTEYESRLRAAVTKSDFLTGDLNKENKTKTDVYGIEKNTENTCQS